jgi:hypothetical protein
MYRDHPIVNKLVIISNTTPPVMITVVFVLSDVFTSASNSATILKNSPAKPTMAQ